MIIQRRHTFIAFALALLLHTLPLLSSQQERDISMGAEGIGSEGLSVGVGLAGSFDTSKFQRSASELVSEAQEYDTVLEDDVAPENLAEQLTGELPIETPNVAHEKGLLKPEVAPTKIVEPLLPAPPENTQESLPKPIASDSLPEHALPEISPTKPANKSAEVLEQSNDQVNSQTSIQATGTGTTQTSGGNPALHQTYHTRIQTQIARNKRYPRAARKEGVTGTVTISFSLDSRGRVMHSSIVKSSGDLRLDKEALNLLIRAEPFPAIPEKMSKDSIDFTLPIEFSLNIQRKMF